MKKSLIIGMAAGIALSCFAGCKQTFVGIDCINATEETTEFTETDESVTDVESSEYSDEDSARCITGRNGGKKQGGYGGGAATNSSSFS